jgi:hypothetical protein
LEKNNNFQPKFSNLSDIQMICAQLFYFINHSQFSIPIIDLIGKLKVPGSTIELNEQVRNALRDIQLYRGKRILSSSDDFQTINIDKHKIKDLEDLQKYIANTNTAK